VTVQKFAKLPTQKERAELWKRNQFRNQCQKFEGRTSPLRQRVGQNLGILTVAEHDKINYRDRKSPSRGGTEKRRALIGSPVTAAQSDKGRDKL